MPVFGGRVPVTHDKRFPVNRQHAMTTTRNHGWMIGLALGVLLAGRTVAAGTKAQPAAVMNAAATPDRQTGTAAIKKPKAAEAL